MTFRFISQVRFPKAITLIALAALAGAWGVRAGDWPEWRGKGRGGEAEMQAHLQNVDMQLHEIAHDLSTGRRESTPALRAEIRALINLIDVRTRPPGSK